MKTHLSLLSFLLLIPAFVSTQAQTPLQAADELLAADRAFSAASAKTDLITGISAMFAPEVVMAAPVGLVYGSDKAIEALRSNPTNPLGRSTWPVNLAG